MNILKEKRRLLPLCGCLISDSDSSQKSSNIDARVVGGEQSTNVSSNGSGDISLVTTDHGAVAGGLAVGGQAIDAMARTADNLSTTGANMFEGALNVLSKANEQVAAAYQSGNAPEQTSLKYAGFAVVGLVALLAVGAAVKGAK